MRYLQFLLCLLIALFSFSHALKEKIRIESDSRRTILLSTFGFTTQGSLDVLSLSMENKEDTDFVWFSSPDKNPTIPDDLCEKQCTSPEHEVLNIPAKAKYPVYTPGFRHLIFVNHKRKEISFTLSIEQYNLERDGTRSYLSYGDVPLIAIHFSIATLMILLAVIWTGLLYVRRKSIKTIHYLLLCVAISKIITSFLDGFHFSRLNTNGFDDTSKFLRYSSMFLRSVMDYNLLFLIVGILVTSFSYLLPALRLRHKIFLVGVVMLQIVVNIFLFSSSETSFSRVEWPYLRNLLIITDFISCLMVLKSLNWAKKRLSVDGEYDGDGVDEALDDIADPEDFTTNPKFDVVELHSPLPMRTDADADIDVEQDLDNHPSDNRSFKPPKSNGRRYHSSTSESESAIELDTLQPPYFHPNSVSNLNHHRELPFSATHNQFIPDSFANRSLSSTQSVIKAFGWIYLWTIIYIYSSRVIVYTLAILISYQYTFLPVFLTEILTFTYFILLGINFRPYEENPYFVLISENVSITSAVRNRGFHRHRRPLDLFSSKKRSGYHLTSSNPPHDGGHGGHGGLDDIDIDVDIDIDMDSIAPNTTRLQSSGKASSELVRVASNHANHAENDTRGRPSQAPLPPALVNFAIEGEEEFQELGQFDELDQTAAAGHDQIINGFRHSGSSRVSAHTSSSKLHPPPRGGKYKNNKVLSTKHANASLSPPRSPSIPNGSSNIQHSSSPSLSPSPSLSNASSYGDGGRRNPKPNFTLRSVYSKSIFDTSDDDDDDNLLTDALRKNKQKQASSLISPKKPS